MTKISALPVAGAVTDDDYLVIVDSPGGTPVTRRVTALNAKTYFAGSGGTGVTDGDKGDITVGSSGASWTVDANAITNTKASDMAVNTIKGRVTAGTGDPEDLTVAQVKTMLGSASESATGLIELATQAEVNTGTDTTRAVTPATLSSYTGLGGGGSLTDGDKGDVTVTGSGAVWTVDTNAITNTKIADMATNTIKGRITAGTGDPEDLTAAQVKTVIGSASDTATGVIELATLAEVNTGTDATRAITPSTLANAINFSTTQFTLTTLTANTSIVIPWGSGRNFKINTAGFDITGATETGAPANGTIYSGTLEIVNTGAGISNIDLTGLTNGLDAEVNIPAAGKNLLLLWSTGS